MSDEEHAGDRAHRSPHDLPSSASVEELAAAVAARFGRDLSQMRRANGASNATWVGEGIAVRVALAPVDMAQETALVRALPREVGHPEVLGDGRLQGHGWIVTREAAGRDLQEVWPELTEHQRSEAVSRLWERAREVHAATPSLGHLVPRCGGFVPASLEEARALAARAADAIALSEAETRRMGLILEEYFHAAPQVPAVVNHGDLALMNALWDDGDVALLDFEYAVAGPVEIDLCRLLLETRWSPQEGSTGAEACRTALEIARAHSGGLHGRALLHGAAVLDQLRDVALWAGSAPGAEALDGWRPDRLLAGLLSPEGGYLTPLL